MLRKRYLGDLDAADDEQFENHFIESVDLDRINSNDSNIIFGSKGVGKTALRRALAELNRDSFYATKTINLDQVSFSQVHNALSDLRATSKTEVPTLARNTWMNVLAIYCLEAFQGVLSAEDRLQLRIHNLLEEEGFADNDSNMRLISHIERAFFRIAEAGLEDQHEPVPLGLSTRQLRLLNAFPANPVVRELLKEVGRRVREEGKYVLICLDGFDSIVDHTPESRRAILAGLIDAVHKCSKDPLFSGAFCFKAFLPQELTESAHAMVWDADKFLQKTYYLRWTETDFQALLTKRLGSYTRSKSARFADIWNEFMPDKIRNDSHGIEEPSLNYILRHTLFRPRQLLAHMQEIFDRWDERSSTFRVDPTFIPPVVANTNFKLAQAVVNQLEHSYPGLSTFLQSLSGLPSVTNVTSFQLRLSRIFDLKSSADAHLLFDSLYTFGLFGVASRDSLNVGASRNEFRFGFVGANVTPSIHTTVSGDDLVALSPMFREFCGCSSSRWGAVIPVAASP